MDDRFPAGYDHPTRPIHDLRRFAAPGNIPVAVVGRVGIHTRTRETAGLVEVHGSVKIVGHREHKSPLVGVATPT